MKKKRFIFWLIMLVLSMGVIFYFSSMDGTKSLFQSKKVIKKINKHRKKKKKKKKKKKITGKTKLIFGLEIRKLAHVVLFFMLGVSAFMFMYYSGRFILTLNVIYATLFSYIYACLDEIHQIFVKGREGRFKDTLIDLLGIVLAVILCFIYEVVKKFIIEWIEKRRNRRII